MVGVAVKMHGYGKAWYLEANWPDWLSCWLGAEE